MKPTTLSNSWRTLINDSLSQSASNRDKIAALDFIHCQNSLSIDLLEEFLPRIEECVLDSDKTVRQYARRARNRILDCYPELHHPQDKEQSRSISDILKNTDLKTLTSKQILLHKLKLQSRFVVFDAMDRLTATGDNALVDPLIEYLKEEKDEYKVSYLLRLMGRFTDYRVPDILAEYLNHEDPRIVANALEALCEFDTPELITRFAELSVSSDCRIRTSAVRALYKYDPKVAEYHISEMVRTNNMTLQEAGVFLLSILRPSNLNELLAIANLSNFTSVRLKALEIQPMTEEEEARKKSGQRAYSNKPNTFNDVLNLGFFLLIATILLLFSKPASLGIFTAVFFFAILFAVMSPNYSKTLLQKITVSFAMILMLLITESKILVLPALLGLWISWTDTAFNAMGRVTKSPYPHMLAWMFLIFSTLTSMMIQGTFPSLLSSLAKIPKLANSPLLKELVNKQIYLDRAVFLLTAFMLIAILTFSRWFPSGSVDDGNEKEKKTNPNIKIYVVALLFALSIVAVNLAYRFSMTVTLRTSGVDSFEKLLTVLTANP